MANLLVTGASGGLGRHLCGYLASKHHLLPLSRSAAVDSPLEPCDLANEAPQWRENGKEKIDWIIHLATTYSVDGDLRMLDNLLSFAKQENISNVLFMSSWVVHFPRRPLSASYIEMKRRCEAKLLESDLNNVRIIRPSVILGEDLSWTRILRRLSPFALFIPPRFSRSYILAEAVCDAVEQMLEGEIKTRVVTLLGDRGPLAEKAWDHRSKRGEIACRWLTASTLLSLVSALFYLVWNGNFLAAGWSLLLLLIVGGIWWALPLILGSISDYFAGFVVRSFEPKNERDIIALCHTRNTNIQLRGYDNAKLYFQRPHPHTHTTISLRRFNQLTSLDRNKNQAAIQAGAHFGELLPRLEENGLWLENYPNYHFISIGACIATAVHGSNLEKPFLADLVDSVRYYDRETDEIVSVDRDSPKFAGLLFHSDAAPKGRVILDAKLQVCHRIRYVLTSKRQPVSTLDFSGLAKFQEGTQHHEIRINTPYSRHAFLQSYRQVDRDCPETRGAELLSIKADAIGRQWNLLQGNSILSWITSSLSSLFVNYEWFFTPEEFSRFWGEIQADRSRFRLYKLLIRYNRRQPYLDTPYHGTVSIDVTIFNTRTMLRRSAELFRRYRPLEHLGKFSIERYLRESEFDKRDRAIPTVDASVTNDRRSTQVASH